MDPIIALKQVIATRPCYTHARIEAWANGQTAMRLSEIMALGDVPASDRVWLAYHLDGWDWYGALTATVDRMVRTYAADCGIPAIELWAQRWLSGDDRTVDTANTALAIARDASRTAHDSIAATQAIWSVWIASWAAAQTAHDASSTGREVFGRRIIAWATITEANNYESEYQLADIIATLQTRKAKPPNTGRKLLMTRNKASENLIDALHGHVDEEIDPVTWWLDLWRSWQDEDIDDILDGTPVENVAERIARECREDEGR